MIVQWVLLSDCKQVQLAGCRGQASYHIGFPGNWCGIVIPTWLPWCGPAIPTDYQVGEVRVPGAGQVRIYQIN